MRSSNYKIKNSDDFSIWFTLLVTLVPALIFFMALIGAIVIQNLPSDEGSDTEDDTPKIGMYSYEEKPNNADIFVVADVYLDNVYLIKENELNEVYMMPLDGKHDYTPSQVYSIRYKETSKGLDSIKCLEGVKAISLFEEESNITIPDSVYRKIYNDNSLISYKIDEFTPGGLKIQLIDPNDFPNEFSNEFRIYKAPNKLATEYSLSRVYYYDLMDPIFDDVNNLKTTEGIDNNKQFNYKSFDWTNYYGYLDPGYYYIKLFSEDVKVRVYFIVTEINEVLVHDFRIN